MLSQFCPLACSSLWQFCCPFAMGLACSRGDLCLYVWPFFHRFTLSFVWLAFTIFILFLTVSTWFPRIGLEQLLRPLQRPGLTGNITRKRRGTNELGIGFVRFSGSSDLFSRCDGAQTHLADSSSVDLVFKLRSQLCQRGEEEWQDSLGIIII